MKKNLLFYITALAAMLTVSCSREDFQISDRAFADGETGLVMRVRSTDPETRLVAPPTTLNEDRLEQFYYFIYAVNPSENATATPVYVGKWTAPEGEIVTGTGTEEKVPLDKLTALASADGNTYSGYVYVIANYKATETDWDTILAAGTPDYSSFTWTYLQNLALPATFQTYQMAPESERMNEKADELHRFKAQDSFVMASAPTSFSVTKGEVGSIDAPLKRLAAKISLEIHLAKWYVQTSNGAYKYTWYSDAPRFQAYLNYAADKGVMNGTPLTYENAGDFFTYRRFAFLSDWTKSGDDYVFPDGSYTEKEPYKWILDTEKAAQTQPVDGQYYTADEDQAGKIVEIDGAIKYMEYTRPAYKITGTPFYSYPYDFTADSGHAPFFKLIVEWTAMNEPADTRATNTRAGSGGVPEVISREFFYKITLPEIKILEANKWYKLKVNLATLGSESDEAAIDVSSDTYFVTDWSDPTNPDKPEINAGRYLNVSSLEKDSDGNPLFKLYGNVPLEIPVKSSHAFSVDTSTGNAPTATYNNYSQTTVTTGSLSYHTTNYTGNNYTITPATDYSNVTLRHTMVTSVASMNSRDIAPITYKFTIHQDGTNGLSQTISVIQYPPVYILNYENYDWADDGASNRNNHRGYAWVNNSYTQWGNLNGMNGSAQNANQNMYVIYISVLESGSTNRIGDPRSTTAYLPNNNQWALAPGVEGTASRRLLNYYPTATTGTANILAPAFRIASSYGVTSSINATTATNRCAAYQEDGHPAGRWRIPTKAEISYIASLSSKGLIPTLFNPGGNYWSANGAITVASTGGTVSDYTGNSAYVRCVYDEWYWGSETVDRTKFTWGDEL
jgi:hypothetical protein